MTLGSLMEYGIKSLILLAMAGLLTTLLRRSSAATRHAVWTTALLAMLLLPVVSSLSLLQIAPLALPVAMDLQQVNRISVDVVAGDSPSIPLTGIAVAIWAALALLIAGYFGLRQLRASVLARMASPWPEEGPEVRLSERTAMPMVCGLFRPAIVLPADAPEWAQERLRVVLLHERMHVARHDTLTVALAQLACALYWFNPLGWFALSRLRAESEQACDDAVLLTGEEAPVYASHLVEIARSVRFDRPIPEGGIPMARMSQLEGRLRALFNPNVNRAAARRPLLAALALSTAIGLVPLSALKGTTQTRSAEPGIAGTVHDPSGAVVPGARIKVISSDKQRAEVTVSREDGTFRIAPLPPGQWRIEVAKEGFALLRMEGVAVAGPEPVQLKLSLAVGGASERLTVAAEAPPESGVRSTPAGKVKRIQVGGNVQAMKLTHKVNPIYPPACKTERVQGTVILRAVISTTGAPLSLEPVNKLVDERLVTAATDAVRQWRWEPTLLNGVPVEVMVDIDINFTLLP